MLVSVTQGAKELGLSPEYLRRMLKAGKWPAYRLGSKAMRVDVDEIKKLGRLIAEARQESNRG